MAGCAHTDLLPALVCIAEGRVTSNVGQNYPYTSETEAERATRVAALVAAREGLADTLAAGAGLCDPRASAGDRAC